MFQCDGEKDLQTLKHFFFFFLNYKTGLAAACLVPLSTMKLKTGGSALWISGISLSNKEQNVFKDNVIEMCMQNNVFKGFKYVFNCGLTSIFP